MLRTRVGRLVSAVRPTFTSLTHRSNPINSTYQPTTSTYTHTRCMSYDVTQYAMTGEVFTISPNASFRAIMLNREKALHSLNLSMVRRLKELLQALEANKDVSGALLSSVGTRSFCAGGDIKSLYEAGPNSELTKIFFKEEYQLNHMLSWIRTPFIVVMDGITMGGGVGLSVHARCRAATENTVFAMPETAIGFFPDVGGSFFLPRLMGELGMYLGLTGAKLKGADVYHAGIATHYCRSADVPRYGEFIQSAQADFRVGEDAIEAVFGIPHDSLPPFSLEAHLDTIDRCFSKNSVEEIMDALKQENTDFTNQALNAMMKASPTALKVTFKQLRLGKHLSFEDCLAMEYRMSQRFMSGKDFYTGVRSMLITKDNQPQWEPATLDAVTNEMVDAYFAPLDNPADELQLAIPAYKPPEWIPEQATIGVQHE